jgi:phosphoglycolate phosphatase-like HAD superfamily hydrolase
MPLCFDLDGTIGSFGGGYVLLRQALGDLWGAEPTAADLQVCAGSTDWEIVDELHRKRFGTAVPSEAYERYDEACLLRFQGTFHPAGRSPEVFQGMVTGMTWLLDAGHTVWLVSGNAPSVLEFKARALRVDPRIPRLGSLPGLDRAGLIRKALAGCRGPHLYVGDRPHDREAAQAAGVPFLGVGEAVPGAHPILSAQAEAEHLVRAVQGLLQGVAIDEGTCIAALDQPLPASHTPSNG